VVTFVTFELGRSDIGFGRLIVDDDGITRKRLIRRQRIAWADVLGYRLGVRPMNATGELGLVFGREVASAIDLVSAARGKSTRRRHTLELVGSHARLVVNWRFTYVEAAIEEALRRIGPPLLADARRVLAEQSVVAFGDLAMRAEALQWKSKPPLARAAVESLAIIDTSPFTLAIQRRGRAWPYARIKLDGIPNVLVALAVAEELGYRVQGRELLELDAR
jgi:hypothetical protein